MPDETEQGPGEPPDAAVAPAVAPRARPSGTQVILVLLGMTAFLYFARPVMLPLFLACLAAMALKPLMNGLACLRIPTVPSAAIVIVLLVATLSVGFVQLGR